MKGVVDLFLGFNEDAQKMLLLSLKEKNKLNDTYISSEHILLALLTMTNNSVCKIFNEYGIYYNNISKMLGKKDSTNKNNLYVFSPLINNIFINLLNSKKEDIYVNDIIVEILSSSNSRVIYLLKKMNVNIGDLIKKIKISNKFKKKNNKSILKELGVNLNEIDTFSVIEREEEITNIMEILCCKNKNNPVLLGDAGVGKTAVVEEVAKRIANGLVPRQLLNKKIYSISMASLVAGTKYRGEFEEKINKLIDEVENDEDIILFIDEIHTLVGAGGADGAIDASNILKPVLARGKIKLIGATTKDEYDKYILNDKALSRRFKVVMIEEPSENKTRKILMSLKEKYESYHNVSITNNLIDKIIYFCNQYLTDKKYPDKAIDILDEVCVSALFDCDNNKIFNLDREKQEIIRLKNSSLLLNDYENAIKYSKEENKINNLISKYNKKSFKNNNKIVVAEKHLLKIMERKTNLPFYSISYNNKYLNEKYIEFKDKTFLDEKIYKNILDITSKIYFNLINNKLYNEIYFYLNIDDSLINQYISIFFPNINIVNLDINNYHYIDDLLCDSFLNKIDKYNFYILNISNYDRCDKSIKNFFEQLKKDGYYIDKNNKKYLFNRGLFIYSDKLSLNSIGFNDSICLYNENSIVISSYSKNKIKDKVMEICKKKNISYTNSILKEIIQNIDKENKIDNLEFYINKLVRTIPLKSNKIGV